MEKSWVMTEEERLQMLKTRLEKKQKQDSSSPSLPPVKQRPMSETIKKRHLKIKNIWFQTWRRDFLIEAALKGNGCSQERQRLGEEEEEEQEEDNSMDEEKSREETTSSEEDIKDKEAIISID